MFTHYILFDEFVIYHVPREENSKANALTQQASGYNVQKRNFQERKSMFSGAEGYVPFGGQSRFGHRFF
jgi:hypothetical protein